MSDTQKGPVGFPSAGHLQRGVPIGQFRRCFVSVLCVCLEKAHTMCSDEHERIMLASMRRVNWNSQDVI